MAIPANQPASVLSKTERFSLTHLAADYLAEKDFEHARGDNFVNYLARFAIRFPGALLLQICGVVDTAYHGTMSVGTFGAAIVVGFPWQIVNLCGCGRPLPRSLELSAAAVHLVVFFRSIVQGISLWIVALISPAKAAELSRLSADDIGRVAFEAGRIQADLDQQAKNTPLIEMDDPRGIPQPESDTTPSRQIQRMYDQALSAARDAEAQNAVQQHQIQELQTELTALRAQLAEQTQAQATSQPQQSEAAAQAGQPPALLPRPNAQTSCAASSSSSSAASSEQVELNSEITAEDIQCATLLLNQQTIDQRMGQALGTLAQQLQVKKAQLNNVGRFFDSTAESEFRSELGKIKEKPDYAILSRKQGEIQENLDYLYEKMRLDNDPTQSIIGSFNLGSGSTLPQPQVGQSIFQLPEIDKYSDALKREIMNSGPETTSKIIELLRYTIRWNNEISKLIDAIRVERRKTQTAARERAEAEAAAKAQKAQQALVEKKETQKETLNEFLRVVGKMKKTEFSDFYPLFKECEKQEYYPTDCTFKFMPQPQGAEECIQGVRTMILELLELSNQGNDLENDPNYQYCATVYDWLWQNNTPSKPKVQNWFREDSNGAASSS